MSDVGTESGNTDRTAPDNAFQLAGAQRYIRSKHNNDRTLITLRTVDLCENFIIQRLSVQPKIPCCTVIGLHKNADGIGFSVYGHRAGSGTDAAFEAVASCSRSGTDVAFFKIHISGCNRFHDVLFFDRTVNDCIQRRIVALSDHRIDAGGTNAFVLTAVYGILDQRIRNKPDIERIGQRNRRFERTELIDLHGAACLSVTVVDKRCRNQLMGKHILLRRQNDGAAGLIKRRFDRAVTDTDTADIGDLIERSAWKRTDSDAVIFNPFLIHNMDSNSSYQFQKCLYQQDDCYQNQHPIHQFFSFFNSKRCADIASDDIGSRCRQRHRIKYIPGTNIADQSNQIRYHNNDLPVPNGNMHIVFENHRKQHQCNGTASRSEKSVIHAEKQTKSDTLHSMLFIVW